MCTCEGYYSFNFVNVFSFFKLIVLYIIIISYNLICFTDLFIVKYFIIFTHCYYIYFYSLSIFFLKFTLFRTVCLNILLSTASNLHSIPPHCCLLFQHLKKSLKQKYYISYLLLLLLLLMQFSIIACAAH